MLEEFEDKNSSRSVMVEIYQQLGQIGARYEDFIDNYVIKDTYSFKKINSLFKRAEKLID